MLFTTKVMGSDITVYVSCEEDYESQEEPTSLRLSFSSRYGGDRE